MLVDYDHRQGQASSGYKLIVTSDLTYTNILIVDLASVPPWFFTQFGFFHVKYVSHGCLTFAIHFAGYYQICLVQ